MGRVKKRNHTCAQNAYAHRKHCHFENKGLDLNASFLRLLSISLPSMTGPWEG